MRRKPLLIFGALLLILSGGGALWWWLHPEPGPLRLKPVAFTELPGWTNTNPAAALTAFQRSCAVLAKKPDGDAFGTYGGTVADWHGACAAAANTKSEAARKFFENAFTPVQILAGRVAEGRFTGYYEPEIFGSRTKHGDYQTPVYGTPKDLVSVDLSLFRPSLKGEKIAGHVENGKLLPFPSRTEIVTKGIDAPVLFYASDKIALFFLHIQGSGRVIFDDGTQARVAYAAQNGQPYTAIGKTLIARGVPREGMSLQVIRAWLKAHPQEADAVTNTDASYIFFELQPVGDASLGAKGAQGVPLTPLASLAVDNRIHGLGTPLYVAGDFPLGRLFIAQDIGGAIRGPIRGDVYFGYGVKAENNAGTQNQMGRYYALLPKAVAARLGAKS